jgi:hypothetical protein
MPCLRRTFVLPGLLAFLLLSAGLFISERSRGELGWREAVDGWGEVATDPWRGIGVVFALGVAVH